MYFIDFYLSLIVLRQKKKIVSNDLINKFPSLKKVIFTRMNKVVLSTNRRKYAFHIFSVVLPCYRKKAPILHRDHQKGV